MFFNLLVVVVFFCFLWSYEHFLPPSLSLLSDSGKLPEDKFTHDPSKSFPYQFSQLWKVSTDDTRCERKKLGLVWHLSTLQTLWPSLSIVYHLLVRYCSHLLSCPYKKTYKVLFRKMKYKLTSCGKCFIQIRFSKWSVILYSWSLFRVSTSFMILFTS